MVCGMPSGKSNVDIGRPQVQVAQVDFLRNIGPHGRKQVNHSGDCSKIDKVRVASTLGAHHRQGLLGASHRDVQQPSLIFAVPLPVRAVHRDDVSELQAFGTVCGHEFQRIGVPTAFGVVCSFVQGIQNFCRRQFGRRSRVGRASAESSQSPGQGPP